MKSKYNRANLLMDKIAWSVFSSAAKKGKIRVVIEDEPGEDVKSVVHAHWNEDEYGFYSCSNCGYEWDEAEYKTKYCPECGAKMDEQENGAEDEVKRVTEVETDCPKIGDQISVNHYTATCQTVTPKGALFLMDQYLDKCYPMNVKNTNRGGYEKSYLRKVLQSEEVLNIFKDIRDRMVPFKNGDLLRIPFAGEMFGDDDLSRWIEPDVHMQWELMRNRGNRLASRCGVNELGWLQNRYKMSSNLFCTVNNGQVFNWDASTALGVRLVFMIKEEER